jgi:ketosteroid isomerase-like protein
MIVEVLRSKENGQIRRGGFPAMRRIIRSVVFAIAVVTAPLCTLAQRPEGEQMKVLPQAELDVVKVLLSQERTWNAGDLGGFLSSYKRSPELVVISNGVAHGFEDVEATYKKNYPDRPTMGTLSFSDLEPRILDDRFAVATGKYSLERAKNKGGNASGTFSLVLEKTAQGWKIILDHTT